MFSLTLEINQVCNLKCRYCYLGEKSGKYMEYSTAIRAIDHAFEKVKIHKDRKLWFDFIGGEPLLSFEYVKKIVKYIYEKNSLYDYTLFFSMTTNATILSEKIIDYLIDNRFNLKISLDGSRSVNDKNRIMLNGRSSHDCVLENMRLLKKYEDRTGKYVQVTNVITKDNFENYYETLVYLTSILGLRVIDSSIDMCADWEKEELERFESVLQSTIEYFFERAASEQGFCWGFADRLLSIRKKKRQFYTCGGGIISSYVRTDGSIFACPANLNSEVAIGHINVGYDLRILEYLKSIKGIENENCQNCELYDSCTANSCIMQSLLKTNDVNKPDPVLCYIQKMFYRLYLKNEDMLLRIQMK